MCRRWTCCGRCSGSREALNAYLPEVGRARGADHRLDAGDQGDADRTGRSGGHRGAGPAAGGADGAGAPGFAAGALGAAGGRGRVLRRHGWAATGARRSGRCRTRWTWRRWWSGRGRCPGLRLAAGGWRLAAGELAAGRGTGPTRRRFPVASGRSPRRTTGTGGHRRRAVRERCRADTAPLPVQGARALPRSRRPAVADMRSGRRPRAAGKSRGGRPDGRQMRDAPPRPPRSPRRAGQRPPW